MNLNPKITRWWHVVVVIGLIIGLTSQSMRGFAILILVGFFYFLPSLLAKQNKKPNAKAIFWLNFLLGWSIIGWIIALVWALTKDEKHTITIQATESKISTASELEKLVELKKNGVITEAEFEQQKKKILG